MNLFGADPYNLITFWNLGNDQLEFTINSLETLYGTVLMKLTVQAKNPIVNCARLKPLNRISRSTIHRYAP